MTLRFITGSGKQGLRTCFVAASDANPEVASWLTRVNTAGGTVSPTTQTAVNNFVSQSKAAGIWSLFTRLNLCCGDFAASFVPLVNSSGGAQDTNVNLISADYAENTGWKTDGTTKYVATGLVPSAATGHQSAYLRTSQPNNTTAYSLMGSNDAGFAQAYILRANRTGTAGTSAGAVVGYWGGPLSNAGASVASGDMTASHWMVNRTTSTNVVLYRAGVNLAQNFTGTTPASNGQELYVMANNSAGVMNTPLTLNSFVSGYSVGGAMTPTQTADFYTIMQTFQTALGRQV